MNLGARKTDNAKTAMVLEITPRLRQNGWAEQKLKDLVDDEPAYVRVTGWLLLDSMHVANTTHARAWEVHPVTEFEICTASKKACDKGWIALENYQP